MVKSVKKINWNSIGIVKKDLSIPNEKDIGEMNFVDFVNA